MRKKSTDIILKLTFLLAAIISIPSEYSFSQDIGISQDKLGVIIDDSTFKYEIAQNGKNLRFIDKATGIDYLNATKVSYCAYATRNKRDYPASSASLKGNLINLEFQSIGVSVEILINKSKDHIELEVAEVTGTAESLTFLNVPLTLKGLPDEPFAVCALSMNLFTHVRQVPALQSNLWATCYQRFGMKGSKVSVLGVPMKSILPVIREVMKDSKDIPYSAAGGAWAKLSKQGYGSYLVNTGTLTEETVADWIKKCASVGFNQIDNHGGDPKFFKFGSFELNPAIWPDGWDHFKRINERLHSAGISSLFHTYAFFIDKKSKYVTPVPSPDLAYSSSFILAEPLGPKDSVIVVKESTENVSAITGFLVQNSRTLRIGNELIEFRGVTKSAPYKFTGCKRSVNGANSSAYNAGEKVYYLKEMFGLFAPGPETNLFKEIAIHTAEIVNENNFDGIYLDAIDGSSILDGPEDSWYYSTKFIVEIAKHLTHPVGMEMSAMEHSWWHYRSRWEAWDAPHRGYKKFIDIHSSAISGGILLPLNLGWWKNFTWNPPQTEPTFTDDIEYLGCKMIGNNAGLSLLEGIDKKEIDANPSFTRLNAIIRQYEELQQKNYFGEGIKKLLRQPGKEFKLFKAGDNSWNFKPIVYQKHKISGINHPTAHWTVNNEFNGQPVKLRIESLLSVNSYNDPANVVLTDFSDLGNFANEDTANGISGALHSSIDKAINGEAGASFSARSSGASPRNSSWIKIEKKFEPTLNLGKNQALGVWIKGDGNGEILNLRLESPVQVSYGARGDHFVKIDFTGWKYFELVEIESAEFSGYVWPNARNVYNSYLNSVQFSNIDKLQLWYNNLPSGKEINCMVGPVKAITTIAGLIENPSITIGGEKIVFPVRMESGMYLEFASVSDCKLFGSKGELLKEVTPMGKIPNLAHGQNEISFSGNGTGADNARMQVTVIGEGKPLQKQ